MSDIETNVKLTSLQVMLDACDRRKCLDKEIIDFAKENGLVIVYGHSDDCIEFEGAIYDEAYVGNGSVVYILPEGKILGEPDCDCDAAKREYESLKKGAKSISVKWCRDSDDNGEAIPWTYSTDINHQTFRVLEDEGKSLYCVGLVFSLKDLCYQRVGE